MALEYGVSDNGIRLLLGKEFSHLLPKEANWNSKPDITPEEVESEFKTAKVGYKKSTQDNVSWGHVFGQPREFHYPFWDNVLAKAFELERFELVDALVEKGCSIERLRFVVQEVDGVSQEVKSKWDMLFLSQKHNDVTKKTKPHLAL